MVGRFVIDRLAGEGGVGEVYRAHDQDSHQLVAVKLLGFAGDTSTTRFTRESEMLAELEHPAIVRYVAHGETEAGVPWLAMEWVEGESLEQRLQRSRLSLIETVQLGKRVTEALKFAHDKGIVHRDIKPANLLLPDGDVQVAKLVDFGVARLGKAPSLSLTGAGTLIGTPKYMAPEQARGEALDHRADLFSLGCVLYECLAGQPPFDGAHVVAVLAKILLEDIVPVQKYRPRIPQELEDLIGNLLEKDRDLRPANAQELFDAFEDLGDLDDYRTGSITVPGGLLGLTHSERQLSSVVLASLARSSDVDETMPGEEGGVRFKRPVEVVEFYGGRLEWLGDGSAIALLSGPGPATDRAAIAGRCALALHAVMKGARIVVATGSSEIAGRLPEGDVIERAVSLLRRGRRSGPTDPSEVHPIWIDGVTANLLDDRFWVVPRGDVLELTGERERDRPRTVLGRVLPTVGRRREMALLLDLFEEATAERCAHGALIVGDPGSGKSRVGWELARELRRREVKFSLWSVEGDPMRIGSPFGLLITLISRMCDLQEGEPIERRQEKLSKTIEKSLSARDAEPVLRILSDLLGASQTQPLQIQETVAPPPSLRGEPVREAMLSWLSGQCQQQPLVLLVDDVQWGDRPSIQFLDTLTEGLAEFPFLLVVLARPEFSKMHPDFWQHGGGQRLQLGKMVHRASARLVREALPELGQAKVDLIVEQSGGNPYYLEELIRTVGEGWDTELPRSILAMVQARLHSLDPQARRALRAASIFGRTFWAEAVRALMGGAQPPLSDLERAELIRRDHGSRFEGAVQYLFVSELVREAGYDALTIKDRTLGHQLAAQWLSDRGERDSALLAEHYERGELPQEALPHYLGAAKQSCQGNDFEGALRYVAKALICQPVGEILGELRMVEAQSHYWRARYRNALDAAVMAQSLFERGSARWYQAVESAIAASTGMGDRELLRDIVESMLDVEPMPEILDVLSAALGRSVVGLSLLGDGVMARQVWARMRSLERRSVVSIGWRSRAEGVIALSTGDVGEFLEASMDARSFFDRIGNVRESMMSACDVGFGLFHLGLVDEAQKILGNASDQASQLGLPRAENRAKLLRAELLLQLGQTHQARQLVTHVVERGEAQGDRWMRAIGSVLRVRVSLQLGDVLRAEQAARTLVDTHDMPLAVIPYAFAVHAQTLLRSNRLDEALVASRKGVSSLEQTAGLGPPRDMEIRLTWAEVLRAHGKQVEAKQAVDAAATLIRERASKLRDALWRKRFLESVPVHQALLSWSSEGLTLPPLG